MLDVRHLALIDAIADTGSVTRAAERLHLTQSALSHQLRDVESRLGLPLFVRAGRRMVLTPAGDRVRQTARQVLAQLARTEDDVRAMATDGHGVLRLVTQCNTGYHWLGPALTLYVESHPRVDVRVLVEARTRPIAALLAGDIDLAIMDDEVDDPRFLVRDLFRDELVALVRPDHAWAGRAWVTARDFVSEHVLLYTSDRADSTAFRLLFDPAGVEPARVSAVPVTEAMVELVAAGLGVAILPRWSIEPALATGRVTTARITARGLFRTWSAVTLRSPAEPGWMRDFIDVVTRHGPRRPRRRPTPGVGRAGRTTPRGAR